MKIKRGFIIREICGEYIVTGEGIDNLNFNKLLSLNDSAAYLWREIERKEFDAVTLASLLLKKYKVDEEKAIQDAGKLCTLWKEIGVVEE